MRKRMTAVFCLAAMALALSAQTADDWTDYYQAADGRQGAALKTALSQIVYPRTERSYGDLWTDFRQTDARSDGTVWDMYSCVSSFTFGTHQDGGSGGNKEGEYYNREHSWPNSWFGGKVQPMYTDLHHVFPTDKLVNNKRGNMPFGPTRGESFTSAKGFSKLGACTLPGYSGTVFEPNDEYKGDFARTYFYMVTCYEEKLSDWYAANADVRPTIDGTAYPGLSQWQLSLLMQWAQQDPVSQKEVSRNQAVYAIQKNRNPYIDYPGLEQLVWGTMTTVPFRHDMDMMQLGIDMAVADRQPAAAQQQYFTVGGRRQQALQKGLNIVRDGQGHVRKVVRR